MEKGCARKQVKIKIDRRKKIKRKRKKFTKHIALNSIYMYNTPILTDYEINPSY